MELLSGHEKIITNSGISLNAGTLNRGFTVPLPVSLSPSSQSVSLSSSHSLLTSPSGAYNSVIPGSQIQGSQSFFPGIQIPVLMQKYWFFGTNCP
jgi:hypothetical protein